MSDPNDPMDRLRDVEMRLFAEIGNQLKTLGDNFRDFTDKMSTQMQDVRERLTRIEASNEADRINKLEHEVAQANARYHEIDKRMTRMETIIAPITVIAGIIASAIITPMFDKLF